MELHQLKYIASVARCGSVAKASEDLYVSKQAISKAIISLEQELGFDIFDRDDKMSPTEEGKEILRHADAMLRELDEIDLFIDARKTGATDRTVISVAFKSFPLDFLFFNESLDAVRLLREFQTRTPGCTLSTYKLSDTAILNALEEGAIDLGFVQGEYERKGIKLVPVSMVETRAITLKTNPICDKASLRIENLRGTPIRSPFDFDHFIHCFISRCRERGFDPLFQEVPLNDDAINRFCGEGGIHLQPFDPSMETAYPESRFMPFHPEDKIDLPLCLAYSEANEKPYVQRLVTFIRNGVRR
ncbi:LysR family transcriptional regulator [Raoultibacter massiliensis]|uniref:LysR family transcriptional regulator n=1 Tax=Raoultibacter massiliensis TaxID=1852371 RepID=UPI000C8293A4|nr:LysR family transcriptional regulator [Raoultibacter massiliensis]